MARPVWQPHRDRPPREYGRRLGSGVFTPALVVDGAKVVVGSERTSVEAAIVAADALPVTVALSRSGDTIAVEIAAAPGPVRVQRIVYDPDHATEIGAGENDGTRLREYRIVREVETLADGMAPRAGSPRSRPVWGRGRRIVQSADLRYRRCGGFAARLSQGASPSPR